MTRVAVFVSCCAMFGVSAAAPQSPAINVELRSQGDAVQAAVSMNRLLEDRSFVSAMESGFPLYVEFRAELRETRSGWFDRTVKSVPWEYVVLYDPVRERFVVEGTGTTEEIGGEDALARRLASVYIVELEPENPGTYYYKATVEARTLSDEDVDEVFDWLKGDDDTTSVRRQGIFTRTARRLLVQVAPLPTIKLTGQSESFEHR